MGAHDFERYCHVNGADRHGHQYRCKNCGLCEFKGAWRGDQPDLEAGYLCGAPESRVWLAPGDTEWSWWKEDGNSFPDCKEIA